MRREPLLVAIVGVTLTLAACGSHVTISAESGTASGTSTGSTTTSSGSTKPGGTGGASSGAGTTSSSSGAGASPSTTHVVPASEDIGQYASFPVAIASVGSQNVVAGPFFVSDVYLASTAVVLDTVQGSDCSVPSSQHVPVLSVSNSTANGTPKEFHGMRVPVLTGQTLCATATVGATSITVLGFRPY